MLQTFNRKIAFEEHFFGKKWKFSWGQFLCTIRVLSKKNIFLEKNGSFQWGQFLCTIRVVSKWRISKALTILLNKSVPPDSHEHLAVASNSDSHRSHVGNDEKETVPNQIGQITPVFGTVRLFISGQGPSGMGHWETHNQANWNTLIVYNFWNIRKNWNS